MTIEGYFHSRHNFIACIGLVSNGLNIYITELCLVDDILSVFGSSIVAYTLDGDGICASVNGRCCCLVVYFVALDCEVVAIGRVCKNHFFSILSSECNRCWYLRCTIIGYTGNGCYVVFTRNVNSKVNCYCYIGIWHYKSIFPETVSYFIE